MACPMSSERTPPMHIAHAKTAHRTRKEPRLGLSSYAFALKRVNSLCATTQARGVMGVGTVRRERGLHLLLNFELFAELRL